MAGFRITLAAVLAASILAGGLWALNAQTHTGTGESTTSGFGTGSKLEELLERKLSVPFREEAPLSEVAAHLARELKVRVVLDPAAMARLDVLPGSLIRLDLEGAIRLRTALPLLLDQLGMTYRFVDEDDLLVLTDAKGLGDPFRQVMEELRDLHRDVHDLQDAVEEIYGILDEPEEVPKAHHPKIVKEPAPSHGHDEAPTPGRIG
ncbi:MAG: hypothetical protein U0800_02725 [Isosphaeraceae bacterium]